MPRLEKEHSALNVDVVRKIRGHMYSVLRRSTNKIPAKSGIYVWRYWPTIPSLEADKLLDVVERLQQYYPSQIDFLMNSRVEITIERTPFGKPNEENFLGIKNRKKIENIKQLLDKNEKVRQVFAHTLEMLVSSSPPIYVGKADNLRNRLCDHFDNKTELLGKIENADLPKDDIYISYILDELTEEDCEVTTSIEEILQRLTNPTYTKRYG
tara:strand:- start:849 stop:1481 length:633 start_codon:yes stop_codon:yes gene_type:complete